MSSNSVEIRLCHAVLSESGVKQMKIKLQQTILTLLLDTFSDYMSLYD